MQNQAILAGIRALVEQIDQLERQNAMKASHQLSHQAAMPLRNAVTNSAIRYGAMSDQVSTAKAPSRAAGIAKRLGVSQRNAHQVIQATGREVRYAN